MPPKHRRKNSRSGGKLTASSVTVIERAGPVIDLLQKLPEVTKISIGHIIQARSVKPRFRFQDKPAALFIYVHGIQHIQLIRAFTSEHRHVQEQIEAKFAEMI